MIVPSYISNLDQSITCPLSLSQVSEIKSENWGQWKGQYNTLVNPPLAGILTQNEMDSSLKC
jgi:hypothetical protein